MPAPRTVDEFLDLSKKSGVLDPPSLDAYVDRLSGHEGLPQKPRSLAKLMIRDGTFGLSRGFQDYITRKKSRPADVAVPKPQSAELTLSYDGHALTVPFVVTYELNRNYNPTNGTENCGSGLVVIAGVLLLLISAGIALPVLVLARLISRWSRRARS